MEGLDICGRNRIVLNPEKFCLFEKIVKFAGFEIILNSIWPCKKYVEVISEFSIPKNITDLGSWFGLINQISYTFASAGRMLPFCQLLKPGTPFNWSQQLEHIFKESKAMIISKIEEGVRIFKDQICIPCN